MLMADATDTTLVSSDLDSFYQQATENTPLLTRSQSEEDGTESKKAWVGELKALWKLVIPNWIAGFLDFSIGSITTVTAGALGTQELNAASLGQITVASLCIAPLIFGLSAGGLHSSLQSSNAIDFPTSSQLWTH